MLTLTYPGLDHNICLHTKGLIEVCGNLYDFYFRGGIAEAPRRNQCGDP